MVDVGALALTVAWVLAIYAVAMSLAGAYWHKRDFVASAEHATLAVWGLTVIAVAALLHALATHDFNLEYVAHYSSSTLPLQYTIAALWGGQAGSLLFWTLILTSMSAVVLLQNRYKNRELMPYVTAVLMLIALFFLSMLNYVTPPFERLAFTPAEGKDLNPLLQNYWMTIHPPALYTGFVGCAIPFAFAMAALISGKLDDVWIRTTRRWTLLAWFFLSLGNLFGAEWAYLVLGWGGYWAWDPVENAAFMPWLTCTAFLHSVMIQEKKNMLKVWNMVLVILTFSLTIFGTFLTRSGVISSVHSFTQSGLGPYFMGFLGVILVGSVGLMLFRLPMLKSENELDSMLSRESAFLLNNLVLVGIAFAVFWGTIFPVISEAVRGIKITVGPPFFNKVNAPLGLILLFLTGVGPVIAWRRASAKNLRRSFLVPVGLGLVGGIILFIAGVRHYYAVVSFSLCIFVMATIVAEFYRGIRARQAMVGENPLTALSHLIGKNRRRYGGYIIHIGMVMMFLAITGTSAFKEEKQITVKPGDSFEMGGYTLRYDGVTPSETPHVAYLTASLAVLDRGRQVDTLRPEKRFYKKPEQPTTEVAIRSTLGADLYVVLGSYDEPTKMATIQAYVNPLVSFSVVGRDCAGHRDRRDDLADACARAGTGVRSEPARARGHRVTGRGGTGDRVTGHGVMMSYHRRVWRVLFAAAVLLGLMTFTGGSARGGEPLSFEELEESLTCQCGCGLTVHSCNHLQCDSAMPLRAEIRAQMATGKDKNGILAYFADKYGEKILSSPIASGFNVLAWVTPFLLLLVGGVFLGLTLMRWTTRRRPPPGAQAPATPQVPSQYDKILEKELKNFDG